MRAYTLSIQTVLFFSPALSFGNLALSFISYYLLYVLQGLVYNSTSLRFIVLNLQSDACNTAYAKIDCFFMADLSFIIIVTTKFWVYTEHIGHWFPCFVGFCFAGANNQSFNFPSLI